jgi:hypothetical protein
MFRRKTETPVRPAVEPIRSVEVPTVTELKRRLVSGDARPAMIEAWAAIVRDLARGYGVTIPKDWTDREIVTKWSSTNSPAGQMPLPGELQENIRRFYVIYEPVRFGPAGTPPKGDPVAVLQSIYSWAPLWKLYLARATYSVDEDGGTTGGATTRTIPKTGGG